MNAHPRSVELHPAARYDIGELALLLNRAYADYYFPVWLNEARFRQMCREMDIDLRHSVVAAAGEPVGIALLSRRGPRGWISGVGVLPLYRRQGIGSAMLRHLQREAEALAMEDLRLEVLIQNRGGLTLYRQLGFRWQRDLLTLSLEQESFDAHPAALPDPIVPMEPPLLLERHAAFHDVPQPWVREQRTLQQGSDNLQGLAYLEQGIVVGYLLYRQQPHHQAIHDLAVQPRHPRRLQVAHALLEAMRGQRPHAGGYVVNWPADDALLTAFVRAGYRIWQRQSEMIWRTPRGDDG